MSSSCCSKIFFRIYIYDIKIMIADFKSRHALSNNVLLMLLNAILRKLCCFKNCVLERTMKTLIESTFHRSHVYCQEIACKQTKNIALSSFSLPSLMVVIHQNLRHGIACIWDMKWQAFETWIAWIWDVEKHEIQTETSRVSRSKISRFLRPLWPR